MKRIMNLNMIEAMYKFIKYICLGSCIVFFSITIYGQVSQTYSISPNSGTNPCTNVSGVCKVLNVQGDLSTSGWTKISGITASSLTNKWSSSVSLPFAFDFFGESVTSYKVSLNGLLTFNTASTTPPIGNNESLPSFSLPSKTIAVFWDQFTVKAPTGTNDFMYYRTFGNSPNRQYWVKWNSVEIGNTSGNAADNTAFAIVFEETTNNIFYVDMYKGTPTTLSLSGTMGLQYDPYHYVQVSGSALTSTTTAYTNNLYFKFTPGSLSSSMPDSLEYTADDLEYCNSNSTSRSMGLTLSSGCMDEELESAKFFAKVDLGEDYVYGQQDLFSDSAGAEITIKGYNSSGTQIMEETARLVINQLSIRKVFMIEIDEFDYGTSTYSYSDLDFISVSIDDYVVSANADVVSDLGLICWVETEYNFNVNTSPYDASTMITLSEPSSSGNVYTFSWSSACEEVEKYEFQLLRLFNTGEGLKNEIAKAAGTVDWSKALSLIVENGETEISLHLTEGTGFYSFRVRPIGNYFDGDEANDKNWGVWSSGYDQNDPFALTLSIASSMVEVIYVNQFDNEKNWIFNRVFAEDNTIGESINYANGLGMLKQSQKHLQTDNYILVNSQLYDYSGRSALQTMAAPVSQGYFSHKAKLVTTDFSGTDLYAAEDFDSTTTYNNPSRMLGGDITRYYSDLNSDSSIANAAGYPFGRTLYYADGTNRPKEVSTPGSIFRIGSTESGDDRTIKIYYSSVSDDELVRVFGDEAYADTAVVKMVQVDPNKVMAVTYQTVEGTTIATCLSDNPADSSSILEKLEFDPFLVVDTISGNTYAAPYSYYKEKEFPLDMRTTLWAVYSLTPEEIQAECGTYCSSCDYTVYGYVKQDGEIIWGDTIFVEAVECTGDTTYEFSFSQDVDPATYTVGRFITINNTNPSSGSTYKSEHRDTMAAIMDEHLDTIFSEMEAYLEAEDVDGFYQYLVDNGYANQTQIDNEEDVTINTGCCEITIPVDKCPPHPCDAGTPDFEELLFSFWEEEYGNAFTTYSRSSDIFSYPDNATFGSAYVEFGNHNGTVVTTSDCESPLYFVIYRTASDGSIEQYKFTDDGFICLSDWGVTTTSSASAIIVAIFYEVYMKYYNESSSIT
jgi:hypothetical protein